MPLTFSELMNKIESWHQRQPAFSTSQLARFAINGLALGWLETATLAALQRFAPTHFQPAGSGLNLGCPPADTTAILHAAAAHLREMGLVRVWRDENYSVAQLDDTTLAFAEPVAELERGAFRRFGLVSRAVHINGHYADGSLAIARRAPTKGIDPNRLDNLAAGGLPHGEAVFDCLIRELDEEAGVPAEIARQARYRETLRTQRNEADGTHDEVIYCYDLLLPDGFTPHNTDGEVAAFYRLSAAEALDALDEMTADAALVTAGFLTRATG